MYKLIYMDLNKYKSGPGLDFLALQHLYNYLENKDNDESSEINILEFGSGFSTQFLVDYKEYSGKNIYIDSFDNDPKWCFQHANKYPFLNLNVEPLLSCNENDFNRQMSNKEYDRTCFSKHISLPYGHPKYWRQRNCFYDVKELKEHYDLVIVDGPNGNGRSLSYLHFKDKVSKGSYILIDDHNSRDDDFDYKFIEYLKNIIPVKEIYIHENKTNPSWEHGVNFALFEVI